MIADDHMCRRSIGDRQSLTFEERRGFVNHGELVAPILLSDHIAMDFPSIGRLGDQEAELDLGNHGECFRQVDRVRAQIALFDADASHVIRNAERAGFEEIDGMLGQAAVETLLEFSDLVGAMGMQLVK